MDERAERVERVERVERAERVEHVIYRVGRQIVKYATGKLIRG